MAASQFDGTITVTFSESVENHKGMQEIGEKAEQGFSVKDLKKIAKKFKKSDIVTELIDLRKYLPEEDQEKAEAASILIIHDPLKKIFASKFKDQLLDQLLELEWDKKAFMKGRVVNKKARYNLCFADFEQNPEYQDKKGRVCDFSDLLYLNQLRNILPDYFGKKAIKLNAEGNNYYDSKECYIGWHGDGERKKIIALRLGNTMPLYFHWYLQGKQIGDLLHLSLKHGDMYIMSEKAGGSDWLKRKTLTLRHAAGNIKV